MKTKFNLAGISPKIYLFNPTCEYAIGNGSPNWQPNRLLQQMEADLDILPMFFATSNDSVLVKRIPSNPHLEKIKKLGFEIPEFIQSHAISHPKQVEQRTWDSIHPWGWSPAMHKLVAPLKQNCSAAFKASPVFNWKAEYRDMYSKKFSLEILARLLQDFPNDNFIPESETARVCRKKEDFEHLILKWGQIMVKAPWSSSGRGLQQVTKTPVHTKVWDKLLGIVKDQDYAMAEPLLKKKLDIAFQFKAEKGKIFFIGISNFKADSKGRYLGNNLNGLPDSIGNSIAEFAQFVPNIVIEPLIYVLESSKIASSYEGYFGVDALVYEDKNGRLKINPCLEINLRYNMGLLSIQLERILRPGIKGTYQTWFEPGKFYGDFKERMEKNYPLVFTKQRLTSGFLSLTDPAKDSQFGAYILVEK